MSTSPLYWPSEPTEMPCEPLQMRFWTTISVELGLNETQSSPLSMWEFWMTMLLLRYVSQPSVFLAGLLLLLLPKMSMLSKRMSVELATSVYHCGL